MKEGWYGDDYLILFAESEIAAATERYAISQALPGFQVLGLCGWDDFILRDSSGNTFCVPTVPANEQYLSPFIVPTEALRADVKLCGKIKWYVKPIVFGGDPRLRENIIWVSHEQHAQLVKWWNQQYSKLKGQNPASENTL